MGTRITIRNARLSFPSLFQKAVFDGKEGKYEATLLFPKTDTKTYDEIIAAIEACKEENKNTKVPKAKYFIQDGDDKKEYDGYEAMWAVKAANKKRPTLIDRDLTPITEDDNKLYAGCYVNAIIEPWSQSNTFGKRINANLLGIQFVKDGEPFGDGGTSADPDEFENLGDDEDF